MRFGSGALLVAVGLLVLWLAVSGRLTNLTPAWDVLNGSTPATGGGSTNGPENQFSNLFKLFPMEAFPAMPVSAPVA